MMTGTTKTLRRHAKTNKQMQKILENTSASSVQLVQLHTGPTKWSGLILNTIYSCGTCLKVYHNVSINSEQTIQIFNAGRCGFSRLYHNRLIVQIDEAKGVYLILQMSVGNCLWDREYILRRVQKMRDLI